MWSQNRDDCGPDGLVLWVATTTGGHGLGLAIVKTLVEGMGGSISVRSKLGEGTELSISLPTP